MRQILQHLRTGEIEVAELPCPGVRPGHLLVQTSRTLISAGTERMLVEFSRASLLAKARSQPEKVRQVLDKIRTDGLMPTLEAVFNKLDEPLPLGYCNAGRVVEVGRDVVGFSVGDRVASNGPHAEMVCVPATLAAKIPDGVTDDAASFTVLSSIGLHGIRLLQPTLGESFVVVGLGLIGLVAAQLLRAHGCRVLGLDVNPSRCELARSFGCDAYVVGEGADPVSASQSFSRGVGADGVLITASAKSDELIHQAAQMCRKRGRIVLVGVIGLNLRRSDFYEKELTFQVSCSYGPGRYDPAYEEQARDYPLPYVRWTEQRNFQAVLDSIASGRLDVQPLISRSFELAEAAAAYDVVVKDGDALGVVLKYPDAPAPTARTVSLQRTSRTLPPTRPLVAVIGAGNFTRAVLLPALKAAKAELHTVASAGGVTGLHAARKFDADEVTTDARSVYANPAVNTVIITTRHNLHAQMAADALDAGKHVFVEKPLAIDEEGLKRVAEAQRRNPHLHLMVGFNRRFAPHATRLRELLATRSQPVCISALVNAGDLPANHWTQDPLVGGGRVVGEACHFIDLLLFLVASPIESVHATMFGPSFGGVRDDKCTISLTFADGSIGTVHYWANGPKSFPKERIEVFSEGRVAVIDNWRRLTAYNWPAVPRMWISQDKGHRNEVALFLERVASGGPPLIAFEELAMVTRASFAAVASARDGAARRLTPGGVEAVAAVESPAVEGSSSRSPA